MSTPDFEQARTELTRARAVLETARLRAARADAALKAATAAARRGARLGGEGNRDAAAEREAEDARRHATDAREAAAAAAAAFATFTDPRANVERFPDRSPFALLPVRIETRFAQRAGGDGVAEQLWVRIYPDDCWIDTFEPTLSANELANAQRYWRGIWRAGGIEADERAAWRGLVAAHGSGRAGWIVDNYVPLNSANRPAKARATDVVLVVATQTALAAAEATAVDAYWQAVWLADGNAAKLAVARTALEAAVGSARAAQLTADDAPYNLADRPSTPLEKKDATVSTAFVIFPPDPPTQQSSWSEAPRVTQFPERFIVLGYVGGEQALEAIGGVVQIPLIVGPDPSAAPASTIHPDGDDLFVPDELAWMVDFERAVEVGMGLAIDLTPDQARTGFDRLLVLGVQLGMDDAGGKAALDELLHHHAVGRSGLMLVPQGTPTHNTSGKGAGYTRLDDADESFDDRRSAPLFAVSPDPALKRDGQWLSELLGVDLAFCQTLHASGASDQLQARAMQRALWPATLGYWMDKMLAPVFSDQAIELTRWFFTDHVSGRGPLPAIAIGGQPYGILPTTAFSRIRWLDERPGEVIGRFDERTVFLARLYSILRAIDSDWTAMSAGTAHVGRPGDAHQTLLDIVGLHPTSVEYHSRYAESLSQLFNTINLWGLGPDFWEALLALGLEVAGVGLLSRLGYSGSSEPDILNHVFLREAGEIPNVIDDRPLSETNQIRAYTDDGRNYIRWLADAAHASLDAVYAEQGFTGNATPQTLLYLYLRHALMLGYFDAGYRLHRSAGFLSEIELAAFKPEPAFVHVAETAVASESRFASLYKTEPRITASPSLLVSEYIATNLALLPDLAELGDQIAALDLLAGATTAELERAFAEHIDVCSYRFDAWLLGFVRLQLEQMRAAGGENGNGGGHADGLYLGAYAWLEDLRPAPRPGVMELPPELQKVFGDDPVLADPASGGYIPAPSLAHAQTAAVLRSGYLANATSANPDTLAVNLSSDRVRLALSLLEGIRNGQSLGALLGYRFERGLHDNHGLAEVDKFIYPLRKAFPLVADTLTPTRTDTDVPIEAIEARNVLDGRKLATHMRSTGKGSYPFGLPGLPAADATESSAIDTQVSALLDVYDAVADLALAEGVHQAVQGNFERVGATLDAYSTGHFPPEPEVVQTPAPGIGLTHRFAVHLRPGLPAPAGATPRAHAEPAVDHWLGEVLPSLAKIGCTVEWPDPVSGVPQSLPVTVADLDIRPIDLLELVKPDEVQSMTELDDRILRYILATAGPRPDAEVHIRYLEPPAGAFSVFEISPLVRSLKTIVTRSRPLRATDAMLQNDAAPEHDTDVVVDKARIAGPKADLDTLSGDIGALLATLQPLVADAVAHRAAIVAGCDGFLDSAVALLERAARFGVPESGWGFAYDWRHVAFSDLLGAVQDLFTRWGLVLQSFDAQVLAYDALPPATMDADRFKALQAAELLVSTKPEPLPATPALMRAALPPKRTAFSNRRQDFKLVLDTAGATYSTTLASVAARFPVDAFDLHPFALAPFEDRAIVLVEDLVSVLAAQRSAIEARRTETQAQLDAHDAATSAVGRATALQASAEALLGSGFRIVPEFAITPEQGDEWANAFASSGSLLDYLTTTEHVDFPVDEWLYGAARVRPMLHAWEATVLLAGALGRPEPSLTPVQLPFEPNAPWLALQFPDTYVHDSDRLLYTAHYSTPFDKTRRQCGLLVDEWTEVIPATTRTTGITFNFDRPDSEAPQSILLVTPASATGSWVWDDLVGALNETLDLAKKRAVEPVDVDGTAFSRFLPATIMAATLYGISITTSLAAANGAFNLIEARRG